MKAAIYRGRKTQHMEKASRYMELRRTSYGVGKK